MIGFMSLKTAAQALGTEIGKSAEYKALRRAEEALNDQDEVKRLLQDLQAMQDRIIGMQAQGRPIPEEVRSKAEGLQMKLESHPQYQQFVAAQANYEKLMQRVNAEMAEGIKQGAGQKIITL